MGIELEDRLFLALTLRERAAQGDGAPPLPLPVPARAVLAARRLARWREDGRLLSDRLFALRLASLGVDGEQFQALLVEEPAALRQRLPPSPWMNAAVELWRRDAVGALPRLPDPLESEVAGSLAAAVRPLLRDAYARLTARLTEARPGAFEAPPLQVSLLRCLVGWLERMVEKSLALELHIRSVEQGPGSGDGAPLSLPAFTVELGSAERSWNVLCRYPVLIRNVIERTDLWLQAVLELLARLEADRPALREQLGVGAGPLRTVQMALGDPHQGGRSVCRLDFGGGERIIYKPRPLALAVHYQELLGWLSERGLSVPFRPTRLLDRGAYGWMELVAHRPCQSREEVKRFFRRQGVQLALLHLLEGRDMHNGNVLADGEHPVLIDLETLFAPVLATGGAPGPEGECFERSVLSTAFLPVRVWEDDKTLGLEVGGLAGAGGAAGAAPILARRMENGQVFFERRPMGGELCRNLPLHEGEVARAADHHQEVSDGFAEAYRILETHRAALLSPRGPLERFAADPLRLLPHSSALYQAFVGDAVHPHRAGNALDRDRLFDRLLHLTLPEPLALELDGGTRPALERGDVPWFGGTVSSTTLRLDSGHAVPEGLAEAGMSRVKRKAARLGDADREAQARLITASLLLPAGDALSPPTGSRQRLTAGTPASPELVLALARSLGDELLARACHEQGELVWLGVAATRRLRWRVGVLGLDLFSGLSGLMLALAYLGEVASAPVYTDAARCIVATIRRRLLRRSEKVGGAGALAGLGGIVYALASVATLWADGEVLALARDQCLRFPALLEADRRLDLAGGAAGALLAAHCVHRSAPDDAVTSALAACADHLLAAARPGGGWVDEPDHCEGGVLHGDAGIAYALVTAAAALGLERRARLVDPLSGGRWDRQAAPGDAAMAPGLSGGLAGVALGRLVDPRCPPGAIEPALVAAARSAPAADHSLCHGAMATVEALLAAERRGLLPAGCPSAGELGGAVVAAIRRDGPRGPLPIPVDAVGLHCGTAGLVYQLVRLVSPRRVPSVVLLEGPPPPV
jgi:type 2 lantibiotic biosynthesis protein LanM